MKKFALGLSFLLILASIHISNGQETSLNYTFYIQGSSYTTTDEMLPFWLFANTNGAVGNETSYLGEAGGTVAYVFPNGSELRGKISGFWRDGTQTDDLQRNELYVKFKNSWLQAIVGAKNPEDRFNGLSVVQDNFLLSGNSRSFPGIYIGTSKPQRIFGNLYFELGMGHYELNDDRFVQNTKLHYKHVKVQWKLSPKSLVELGLEHYAQWDGVSPNFGPQPDSFSDFRNILLARKAGGEAYVGEQDNALGNHLGFYDFTYKNNLGYGWLQFYHQHPFEDGSGTALKNFPDGIWGLFYERNDKTFSSILDGLLLEYFQTTNQSGSGGRSGRDNYFRNGVYASGWTYEGNVIGLPFIPQNLIDNRVFGINAGIALRFKDWQVRGKLSYSVNKGNYNRPIEPSIKRYSSLLELRYNLHTKHTFSARLGSDILVYESPIYGFGISYKYSMGN